VARSVIAPPSDLSTLTDLDALAASFRRAPRARNRSPRTVDGYGEAVRTFRDYLRRMRMPTVAAHIRREHVESFIADQLDHHRPNTAAMRYRALQQLFRWLREEGEVTSSPMTNMRPPMVPEHAPAILSDDEIRRLLHACESPDFVRAATLRSSGSSPTRVCAAPS